MEGLEGVVSQNVLDDIKKKYTQNTHFNLNKSADQVEVVEQMTKVSMEFSALLHLISSKSNSQTSLPAITKKGNLFDFKG